jgi:transposase
MALIRRQSHLINVLEEVWAMAIAELVILKHGKPKPKDIEQIADQLKRVDRIEFNLA